MCTPPPDITHIVSAASVRPVCTAQVGKLRAPRWPHCPRSQARRPLSLALPLLLPQSRGPAASPGAPGMWGPRGHRLSRDPGFPQPPAPRAQAQTPGRAGDVGARPPGGVRQAPVCSLSAGSGPAGTRCHLIPGQEMAAGPRQENGGLPCLPPGDLGPSDGRDGSSIRNPRPEPPLCPRVLLRL